MVEKAVFLTSSGSTRTCSYALDKSIFERYLALTTSICQVRVYSGRGSGQVRTETDEGQGQGAGQGVSPAGVGDRLDSTTKDNER